MRRKRRDDLSRREWWMFRAGKLLVPEGDRADWTQAWEAELWHLHHRRRRSSSGPPKEQLTCGLLLDAVWVRADSIRRSLHGTAFACLLSLAGACLLAALIGYLNTGSLAFRREHLLRLLLEAPLLLIVTWATMSRRHVHDGASLPFLSRVQDRLFFSFKCALILTLSFLTSTDLAEPAHDLVPLVSDLTQTLLCAVFAIAGLRWAILDQQARCKHCLLKLTSPARTGRPSHNLLEWNGTEQVCRKGHGRLSSPEMESSWCSYSRWVGGHWDGEIRFPSAAGAEIARD